MVGSRGTALRSAEVRQEPRQTRSPSPAKGCTRLCSPSPGRTAAQRSRSSRSIPFPLTSVLLHIPHGVGHTIPARASCSSKVGPLPPCCLPWLASCLQPGKPAPACPGWMSRGGQGRSCITRGGGRGASPQDDFSCIPASLATSRTHK